MVLYALYIFHRNGTCLYYADWNRSKKLDSLENNQKLMFGMLHSLKRFCSQTSPVEGDEGLFRSYTTNQYKLHYFETPTGIRFVLLSDLKVEALTDELSKLYIMYVDYAVRNPLYTLGTPITCQNFVDNVSLFVQASKYFKSA